MVTQVCKHLSDEATTATGKGCMIPGNCPNLYNDVHCPIKHYLYNCSHIIMDFAEGQLDPIAFHCGHPNVGDKDWVCPVRGNSSVKCPLRANYK